jgi:hypothetical protein
MSTRIQSIYMDPKSIYLVHSQCESRTFLGGSKWKACFAPTPSVGVVQLFGGVYVISDLGSMKHLSTGVTELDQTQHKVRGICGWFCHERSYMALVGIWTSFKEHAIFDFCFVKINPKFFARNEQVSCHPTISHPSIT